MLRALAVAALSGTPASGLSPEPWIRMSIHPISLRPLFKDGSLDPLSYPKFVRETFRIDRCEHDTQFFAGRLGDESYFKELRRRCDDAGVESRVLLVSPETPLTAAGGDQRSKALDEHLRWRDVAGILGCEFLRVQTSAKGEFHAAVIRATMALSALRQKMGDGGPQLLTENIGGLSRDPAYLISLVTALGPMGVGLIADFGNFDGDREDGMRRLLPHARSLCAKSAAFSDDGTEVETDYFTILRMVKATGFSGDIAIEYVGGGLSPVDGVRATEALVQRAMEAA